MHLSKIPHIRNILNNCILLLFFIHLFFFPFSVSAKNLNVPYQYETIQDAVRFAAPNDTILVAPGTYQFLFENLKIINISLTLKSSAGPLETIISGKGTTPIITIDGISKVTIEGFTITSRKTAGSDLPG